MFANIGISELLIVSVIVLLFFGSKKLNELAKGLGESTKEYTKLKNEYQKAINNEDVDNDSAQNEAVAKDVKSATGGGR